jgi:hypothetical protein
MHSSSSYVYCEDVAITFLTVEQKWFRISQERRSDTEKRDDSADERGLVGTICNKEKMVRKSDENEQCEIMRNELDLKGRCEADHPPMYLISIREVPGVCPSQVGCHCPKELTKRWSLLMRELEEDFLEPLRMNRQLQGTLRAQKVTYQKTTSMIT